MEINYSVVIPLYNHEEYIAEAIESVLNQSYPADEILVIDDGSTDDSFNVAQKIASSCSKIKVLQQTNQGAHTTLNKLIELAKNEYIAILNSDDVFFHHKLEKCQQLIMRSSNHQLICGNIQVIDNNGNLQKSGEILDWLVRAKTFKNNTDSTLLALLNENYVVSTSNMVFSKKLWASLKGFQNLRYCHDLDFITQAASLSKILVDDGSFIKYRVHTRNTIKENLLNIKLEIASVIANVLVENRNFLLEDGKTYEKIKLLNEIFENKNVSNLILLLVLIRNTTRDRFEFYNKIKQSEYNNCLLKIITK